MSLREFREKSKIGFLDAEPNWRKHWWGMPSYEMKDAMPQYKVVMNFMTLEDLEEFSERIGVPLTPKSIYGWYPHQERMKPRAYEYVGKPTDSRYPVCIPSKSRWDNQKTGTILETMGVTHYFFVEEEEYDEYCAHLGSARVIKMPFSNLGKGSIPARNFIWDWADKNGYARHWVVDDNITSFYRMNLNRRVCVVGGGFFRAMEDFVDRYENIILAGPHETGFFVDRDDSISPVRFNSRIYSCILIDTATSYRWRGRYNEDTDLSLRVLKDGKCTCLFCSLQMDKMSTAFSKGGGMKGGNTDNVYTDGDHRLMFVESLRKQHPDCVKIIWRYNRWHHSVDYSRFKSNKPIQKSGIVPTVGDNEYGMRLRKSKE